MAFGRAPYRASWIWVAEPPPAGTWTRALFRQPIRVRLTAGIRPEIDLPHGVRIVS